MFHFIIRSVGRNCKTYGFFVIDDNIVHAGNLLIANPKVVNRNMVNTVVGISWAAVGRHDEI